MTRQSINARDATDEAVPQFIGGYSVLTRISNHKATAVFRAYDTVNQRDVCIKRLTKVGAESRSSIAAMEREVRFGKALDHVGLVKHYRYDTSGPRHFFVMEYFAPGATLANTHVVGDTPFPTPPLKPALIEVLEALAYVHGKGLVHRDIKPDNILINEQGAVKVIDFSVAFEKGSKLPVWKKLFGARHKVVGTRTYMAPEQIGGRDVDARADLYSFGVMMFELLAGRPPFNANNPDALLRMHLKDNPPALHTVKAAVTPEASSLVGMLMHKDPALRAQKCEDVIHILRRIRLLKTDPD